MCVTADVSKLDLFNSNLQCVTCKLGAVRFGLLFGFLGIFLSIFAFASVFPVGFPVSWLLGFVVVKSQFSCGTVALVVVPPIRVALLVSRSIEILLGGQVEKSLDGRPRLTVSRFERFFRQGDLKARNFSRYNQRLQVVSGWFPVFFD